MDGWKAEVVIPYGIYNLKDGPPDLDAVRIDKNEVKRYRSRPGVGDIINYWNNLVMAYTSKFLTFPRDRMLAISALTSEFGRVLDDVYLAGMWKCSFPVCLFWVVRGRPEPRRPRQYQGPSWSWTGVEGCVAIYVSEASGSFVKSKYFELIGYQIKLTNDLAPYGSLEYFYLTIRCRLKRAEWVHHSD